MPKKKSCSIDGNEGVRLDNTFDQQTLEVFDIETTTLHILEEETDTEEHGQQKTFSSRRCNIHVQNQIDRQKSCMFRWEMNRPLGELINEYAQKFKVDSTKIILMRRDRRFYHDDTPKSLGFFEDILNEVEVFETYSPSELPNKISIKWQMFGKKPIVSHVLAKMVFSVLKENFCKENGLPIDKVRLVLDSETIRDDATPEVLDLENGDCIDVYIN